MDKLSFKVAEYEGPLDLLLHLIAKHKLNIYDIEISVLLEQYVAHIQTMQEGNMEVASEFLDMASRLIHIKTVSLLPRHEEEEEKAKAELVGQLVEYAACKQAAAELMLRSGEHQVFVRLPTEIELDMTYRLTHPPEDLLRGYFDAVGKGQRRLPPRQSAFSPLVSKPVVSVNSRIMYIMRRLYKGARLRFLNLFYENKGGRSEIVATFLAVLELVKSKRVTIGDDMELNFQRSHVRDHSPPAPTEP